MDLIFENELRAGTEETVQDVKHSAIWMLLINKPTIGEFSHSAIEIIMME